MKTLKKHIFSKKLQTTVVCTKLHYTISIEAFKILNDKIYFFLFVKYIFILKICIINNNSITLMWLINAYLNCQ